MITRSHARARDSVANQRRARDRGFALLLVLVVVLIAGAALAGVARLSASEALSAQAAERELQRRWIERTAVATLLGRADALIEAENQRRRTEQRERVRRMGGGEPPFEPVAELRVSCELAGVDYDLVLTDEQAKANVNRLLADLKPGEVRRIVGKLIDDAETTDGRPAEVRLQPISYDDGDEPDAQAAADGSTRPALPPIGSFAQVFERITARQLVGEGVGLGHAAYMTCWGDGRVNIHRVRADVLHAMADKTLGRYVVNTLLAARAQNPGAEVSELIKQIDTTRARELGKVMLYVADASYAHGLWIVPGRASGLPVSLTVDVRNTGPGEGAGINQRFETRW